MPGSVTLIVNYLLTTVMREDWRGEIGQEARTTNPAGNPQFDGLIACLWKEIGHKNVSRNLKRPDWPSNDQPFAEI